MPCALRASFAGHLGRSRPAADTGRWVTGPQTPSVHVNRTVPGSVLWAVSRYRADTQNVSCKDKAGWIRQDHGH